MDKKFYLIRGPRIINQLIEASAADLERNTMNFIPPASPTARQHVVEPIQINKIQFIPQRQSNSLIIKVNVTSNGHPYEPSFQFENVIYDDSDQSDNTTFKAADRQEYHIIPIDLKNHNAKVRCNCLDFYYRFAPSNNANQSLLGSPPPPYVKTSNKPYVNPKQVPALCKHLLKAIQALRSVNVVRQ